jgi:hypothetical protein
MPSDVTAVSKTIMAELKQVRLLCTRHLSHDVLSVGSTDRIILVSSWGVSPFSN